MHAFSWSDWFTLFLHFLSLSLLSIGGAITTVPDMHRFLVGEKSWLSDNQFTGSIALAQAAPGPNVLFVAVLGWNIGMNAGGGIAGGASAWGMAFAGVFAAKYHAYFLCGPVGASKQRTARCSSVQDGDGTDCGGSFNGNWLGSDGWAWPFSGEPLALGAHAGEHFGSLANPHSPFMATCCGRPRGRHGLVLNQKILGLTRTLKENVVA